MPGLKRTISAGPSSGSRDESVMPEITDSQLNVAEQYTQSVNSKLKRQRRYTQSVNAALVDDDADFYQPAEAGIILKLELHNFMCHHAFSLDFGEQTNFIIGRNGSGKSAILTGLSVALGAQATDTDRGNSLKALIMHGKNVARAKVTFKNEGADAYKPNQYGDRIVVERTIKAQGTHTCVIKNANGKTISTKKKVLTDILQFYGITIANPMTILTQTEAKTFMSQSNDTDKFKYFMQGTRLQESYDNVTALQNDLQQVKASIKDQQEIVTEAQDQYEDADKVVQSFVNSEASKKRQRILSGKRLWIDYVGKEKKQSRARELLDKRTQDISTAEESIGPLETSIESCKSQKRARQGEASQYKQKQELIAEKKSVLMNQVNAIEPERRELQAKVESGKEDIKNRSKSIKEFEKKIEQEKIHIAHSTDEARQKLTSFKATKDEELVLAETESAKVQDDIKVSETQRSTMFKKMDRDIAELKSEYNNRRKQYNSVVNSKASGVSRMYGENMANLLSDIKHNSRKFNDPIKGPLGADVELKNEYKRWSWVLETILQRSLSSFVVQNIHDSKLLKDRVQFFRTNSDVTVRKREIFQYTCPENQLKIIDVLDIPDANDACTLIDLNSIHSTVLIADRREAESALLNDRSNRISSAICFVHGGALRIFKRFGKLQTDPIQPPRVKPNTWIPLSVHGDREDPVNRVKRELDQAKANVTEKEKEKDELQKRLGSKILTLKTQLKSLKEKCREIKTAIFTANSKLESMVGGRARIEVLEEQCTNARAQQVLDEDAVANLQTQFSDLMTTLKAKRDEFASLHEDEKELQSSLSGTNDAIKRIDSEMDSLRDDIQTAETSIETYKEESAQLTDVIIALGEQMKEIETNALTFCSLEEADLQPTEKVEDIDQEINAIIESQRVLEEEIGVSMEEAVRQRDQAADRLRRARAANRESIRMFNKLVMSWKARFDNLTSTTSLMITEVNAAFEASMRLRHFRGHIVVDMDNRKLTLKVSTKPTEELRNVESFSGGEKSYAQISFLLAIWKPMQSRVRGLDEFDVFMDQANRRLALKLILEKVKQNPKTQTIFITPLSMGNIPGLDSPSVHIHEITPPER